MKLQFFGAAHEVTGSAYLLEARGHQILIDYGMLQGAGLSGQPPAEIDPKDVDCVVLTHAHIDHSGYLPLLYKRGYRGPVYTVQLTKRLAQIMLLDSAYIQETEAEWKNRKATRSGKELVEPLYSIADAEGVLELIQGFEYEETVELFPGVSVVFIDAGHLLGSATVTIAVEEEGETKKIVFSGDIGNLDQPLLLDPKYPAEGDFVVMESTYGDSIHEAPTDYKQAFSDLLKRTFDRGGNVIIPSFAVGRTQEVLYFLREIKENNLPAGHADFVVFVDSPLAIEATGIFMSTPNHYYDEETLELINNGINPIGFPGLYATRTSDESKQINFDTRKKVIISASGMCEAGRIRHHLKHNLWSEKNTVLFVGYQAEGTLGRRLVDGEKEVRLFGEDVMVRAEIVKLPGTSSHADQPGLIRWLENIKKKPQRVFVTHGDEEVADFFAELLESRGYTVTAPYLGAIHDLTRDEVLQKGEKRVLQARPKQQDLYDRLVAAEKSLSQVIRTLQSASNKDMRALESELRALTEKYKL